MKILLFYNYPVPEAGYRHASSYANRFIKSYLSYPPLVDHGLIIISSGGKPSEFAVKQFEAIPNSGFFFTDGEGWDCGNYVKAALRFECDMMFCCGSSTYFRRTGWLKRIAEVWKSLGPGMYGTLATLEHSPVSVVTKPFNHHNPHLNTTGFAVSPKYLREYPVHISSKADRYNFEHGPNALWRHVESRGLPVRLVTWTGIYPSNEWRKPLNGYRSGDQSDCISLFNHSDDYDSASPEAKVIMKKASDGTL